MEGRPAFKSPRKTHNNTKYGFIFKNLAQLFHHELLPCRTLLQWSRLYQEILEVIAEVCSANGSPLILLSSRGLVSQ